MRNSKIAYIVKKAETEKDISDYELRSRRNYINMVIKYIREVVKEFPNISAEELKEKILIDMGEERKEYCIISNIRGRYFQLEAAKKLLEDRSIIEREYEKIRDDERYKAGTNDFNEIYTSNLKKSLRLIVAEGLIGFRNLKQTIPEDEKELINIYNQADEKKKRRIEQRIKDKREIGILRQRARLCQCTEVQGIYETIKLYLPILEEELKQEQIKTMEHIAKTFNRYNMFARYKRDNDKNMSRYGLGEYTYELTTNEYDIDKIGIEELFSKEFLETLDLEAVTILNTFWQNRYVKEYENIGEAIFAIDTLDLWEKIINSKEDNIEISDEDIKVVCNKIICVRDISASLLNNLRQRHREITQEEINNGYSEINDEREIENIGNQEGENYKRIFDRQTEKSPNDLYRDIITYKGILNHVENIYQIRNSILSCIIREMLDSKKCKNWGIIQEEIKNPERERSDNYILIGIDYEGFNMPLRLHIKKEFLKDIVLDYNGESKIPIYEGATDFVIYNQLLPTNILMPLQKKQKQIITKKYKEAKEMEEQRSKLIAHLRFIKDQDKYPEHLKKEIHTSEGVKKVRPERRYYDLVSGEVFEKREGEYIQIDSSGGKGVDGRE